MSIVTEYSLWFGILCLGLAIGGTWILYRHDKTFSDLKRWKVWIMAGLRFILLFILSFLLLSPLIKVVKEHIEKPVIIFAQDNSGSVLLRSDSTWINNQYSGRINQFIQGIPSDYEVRQLTFGEKVQDSRTFSFDEKMSDYNNLFNEIESRFSGTNIGAVVISGDGIVNHGENPVNIRKGSLYPIYTIALGDTSQTKDIIVKEAIHNEVAFLGNAFPVIASIQSYGFSNDSLTARIFKGEKQIDEKSFRISSVNDYRKIQFMIPADATGLQKYRLEADYHLGEANIMNNSVEFIVEVIDTRQKILILYDAPHPDIGAVREAMGDSPGFELEVFDIEEFKGKVTDYNLVVLHQLPSVTNSATDILSQLSKVKTPVLFMCAGNSSYEKIDALGSGLSFKRRSKSWDEARPQLNEDFKNFSISPEFRTLIKEFPPLNIPFGDYNVSGNSSVLMSARISNIPTGKPLIFFSQMNENKYGFFTGEGIWRWRISSYVSSGSHIEFDNFIRKIVQYLSLQIRKNDFIVKTKKIIPENEPVIIDAELYNESFELDNTPDVKVEIKDSTGRVYSYEMIRSAEAYRLKAGIFPSGIYTYKATISDPGKNREASGSFSVHNVAVEALETVADHQMLRMLAEQNGGKMFYPDNVDELAKEISENKDVASVSYEEQKLIDLINLKWIFFILLTIAATEWFLRKFFGSY